MQVSPSVQRPAAALDRQARLAKPALANPVFGIRAVDAVSRELDGKAAARWPSHARALAPVRPVAAAGVGGRGEMSGNFGPGEARLPRPESRPDAGLQQPSHPSQAGRPAQRARRVQEPPQGTESQES